MLLRLIILIFSIMNPWNIFQARQSRGALRPQVIVIADEAAAVGIRSVLAAAGFRVIVEHSLLAGYEQTYRLLALTKTVRPTIILIDLLVIEPGFPELTGTLLVAAITRQMQMGQIRRVWMVGGAPKQNTTLRAEATVLGCHEIVALPLTDEALATMRSLAEKTPPPSSPNVPSEQPDLLEMCQNIALRVLESVQAAQVRSWTPEDAALILSWLTPYPAPGGSGRGALITTRDLTRVKRLLRAFGNQQVARQQLEAVAIYWQQRYPLHGEVLQKFLDGWERREIVRYFVDEGLYEDSRVYHCIKELPQRLSDHLQRYQIGVSTRDEM